MKKKVLLCVLFFGMFGVFGSNAYAVEVGLENTLESDIPENTNENEDAMAKRDDENKWVGAEHNGIELHNKWKIVNNEVINQYQNSGSYRITNYEYENALKFLDEVNYDFSNETIAFLGDSITAGANSGDDEVNIDFETIVKDTLDFKEVYNFGVGGSTIGDYWDAPMCLRYNEIPKDVNYIVVFGGINDVFCVDETLFGDLNNRTPQTFCGDMNRLMSGIKNEYPNAKVLFVTPMVTRLCYNLKQDGEHSYILDESLYANVIKTLASEYGFPIFDLYSSGILNSYDNMVVENYMPDTVHPNNQGYTILGKLFSKELVKLSSK